MKYNEAIQAEMPQPDFSAIYNELIFQVSRTVEFAHSNTNLANCLKPMAITESKDVQDKKEQLGGFVSLLWEQINKLKEANDMSEKAYSHSRSVIGN